MEPLETIDRRVEGIMRSNMKRKAYKHLFANLYLGLGIAVASWVIWHHGMDRHGSAHMETRQVALENRPREEAVYVDGERFVKLKPGILAYSQFKDSEGSVVRKIAGVPCIEAFYDRGDFRQICIFGDNLVFNYSNADGTINRHEASSKKYWRDLENIFARDQAVFEAMNAAY